jgi:CBS domain-containing protein
MLGDTLIERHVKGACMTNRAEDAGVGTGSDAFHGGAAPVSMYMNSSVIAIAASTTVRDAAATIAEETIGCVVVGTSESVVGVVSERDIVRLVGTGADLDEVTVGDLVGTSLVWVDVDATVEDVATRMMQDYVRHVLVGDGEQLVGIVSIRDVVIALANP